jgi:CubicO group peptidase (beta-lactamase class C family)
MSNALYAIARNGEIFAEQGGAATVPWWSYTKTVLAAAALTLVRDGALELDARVNGERFTLRQLLQHHAGLCDYGELGDYHAAVARGDKPWPVAEMLQRADAGRLRYEPGDGWRYSNIGYLFAGRIIERAAGAPLASVLARRIFEPLGLGTARFAVTKADLIGVDIGQAGDYDPGWVYHGLLVGDLSEAALLLDRLLSAELLPPNLIAQMLHAHPLEGAVVPERPWRSPGYGLGVMMEAPDGPVGHTGGGAGSSIAVYQSRKPVRQTVAVFAPHDDVGWVENLAWTKLRV